MLKDKLDWKVYGRKHHESKYTSFVQSYIQTVKFNIDYRRATLSTQICTGEITRNEALEILKNSPFDQSKVEADKEYVCKKLDISTQEFEEIMSLPVKLYKDYPNDHKKLEFIYNVYRKYFKKPTFTL